MDITNEKLYLEILKIKKLLHQSLDIEKDIREIEEEIKLFEGKQVEQEERISKAVKRKKFNTIIDWKRAIWDFCSAKKEHMNPNSVSFYCTILKGPCRFETCPKNIMDD